jgi:hypothetical protein
MTKIPMKPGFVIGKPFQSGLIFLVRLGAYTSEDALKGASLWWAMAVAWYKHSSLFSK